MNLGEQSGNLVLVVGSLDFLNFSCQQVKDIPLFILSRKTCDSENI